MLSFSKVLPVAAILCCILSFANSASVHQAIHARGRSHTLPDDYKFHSRDGWKNMTVGNSLNARTSDTVSRSASDKRDTLSDIVHLVNNTWNDLTGTGSSQDVTITWYTGQDLLNPSCWSNPSWHPTDDSFACALTADGWDDHPSCFSFIEVCHTNKKCVFVRVVDSCAGCAVGSKHVDLTKAAFSELADLNEGVLTVQMRHASGDPKTWYEDLWGPKA